MRFRVIAGAMVVSLGMISNIRGAGPRFYPDDPIAVDHDRLIDVTTAHKIDLDDYLQLALPDTRRAQFFGIDMSTVKLP